MVGVGVLFALLVGCTDFGVEEGFLLFVFCGVVCCSVYVIIPVLPNRKAEIPEVSHKVCHGVCIVE